jgi:hypothetical protein
VSPAERRERQLAETRAAGAALVKDWPPMSEQQIERLAFLLAPSIRTAPAPADAPKQQLPAAA